MVTFLAPNRVIVLLMLAVATGGEPPVPTDFEPDERLPVAIEGPPPGPHVVGQAIPVRVFVTAGRDEPTLEAPEHPDIDVIAAGGDVRPVSGGAIGPLVHETNHYRTDFWLVPRRGGTLILPAFRARVGRRAGASGPIRLQSRQPPSFGRPAWFLGGVGPLEVEVIARPQAIRLGESVEVEIRLTGPGAIGSTGRPTLRTPDGAVLDAKIVPLPPSWTIDPPSRSVPFLLRPSEAGTTSLAPVLVAWFDPETRSYRTVGSESLSIRVDDPPMFDPSAVEISAFEVGSAATSLRDDRLWRALGISGGAIVVLLLAVRGLRRIRRRLDSARRYAARQSRRIAASTGLRRAELATGSLTGYLSRAIGRPEGALTPPEAHTAMELATGEASLGDRAARLITSCDLVRYSGRAEGCGTWAELDDAPALFRELARIDPSPLIEDRDGRSTMPGHDGRAGHPVPGGGR